MNKKLLILVSIIIISSPAYPQEKSQFDIHNIKETGMLYKASGIGYEGQKLTKAISELTLIQGGYFTIGTNQGLAHTNLDDHCGITFGHPYALTSYPLLGIDGAWGKLEAFFIVQGSLPVVQGDSLVLSYVNEDSLYVTFYLKLNNTGDQVFIASRIQNRDNQPHSIGLGLVFDPALGKKGDGWVKYGAQEITRDTLFAGGFIPKQFVINERLGKVSGIKLQVDMGASLPDKLILANWKDIYQNHEPAFVYSDLRKLYDLTLKLIWAEQSIAAGGQFFRTVTFKLEQPDFNTPLFMRWDLPGFLSLENNLLFPRSFDSFVETVNLTTISQTNAQLKFQFPDELFSGSVNYPVTVPGNEVAYQKIPMQTKQVFDDRIVDLSVTLEQNSQVRDQIFRQIFIPAIPLSDTGLVCTIDTVITSEYPKIKLAFETIVAATGQKLFNLSAETIFLYENNMRIRNFSLGKDTTGGAMAADIIFVLDVTGSMGNEIDDVKNNIIEFCDSLKTRGIDYRLGLVCFLDIIENVYNFTSDAQVFKSYVAAQQAHGGGDLPENSLDALYRASQFPFRDIAKRIFIWITDDRYHELDAVTSRNRQEVLQQLLLHDITVHSIGPTYYKTDWYNPIIEPTGGNFYDINGNFRDILLDISRIKSISRYLIGYTSPGALPGINQIKLVVHYAGLGGIAYAEYQHSGMVSQSEAGITCYPNPFNPIIQIAVNMGDYRQGTVEIFNILGQRVRSFILNSSNSKHVLPWDAKDNFNREVGVGNYFIRLNILGDDGNLKQQEITKILYLK